MAKKFLVSIDLTKQELQNAALHKLGAAPLSPTLAQVYYNTIDNKPYYWDGTKWELFGDGTVTSVNASGGTTGLSFSGGPITSSGTLTLAGTLGVANGGTGSTNASGARTNLGATSVGSSFFTLADSTTIRFPRINADNTVSSLNSTDFRTSIAAGTVNSVGLTMPNIFTVINSPITNSGNLTVSLASQPANSIFAGPSSGGVGTPSFRQLVSADIPVHSITEHSANNWSVFHSNGSGVVSQLALGAAGTYLRSAGTAAAPTFSVITGTDVTGTALTANNDTNVTITLGGTPNTALLRSTSITLGWTGTLSVSRGGTGTTTLTGILVGNGTSAVTSISGSSNQMLRRNSANTNYEFFTPGSANTIATLDSNGKIPTTQIPDSILGQVKYISTWNASTNTPTLPSPATVKGDYYVVSTGGTQTGPNFEGGSLTWEVGDWVISNGTVWQKVDNTDAVTMVFGRIGSITAQAGDYASFYVRHDVNNQGLTTAQQGNARTNINAQVTITGGASTITTSNLTANRALISNDSGKVSVSTVTSAELGYLSGVTSAIQTQLNGKFNTPTGTTSQYLRGDGSLATFPTLISQAELNAGTVTTARLISAERISTWYNTKTFAQTIGNGTLTSFNIDHNLNSRDVVVQVYDTSTNEDVEVGIVRSTVNRVVLTFNVAPSTNSYRVVIKV